MKRLLSIIGLTLSLALITPLRQAFAADAIYLTDTLLRQDNKSALYTVTLTPGSPNRADLTLLTDLVGFNHVDAIAASADGNYIYMIDDGALSTRKMFTYDISANTYTAGNVITGMGAFGTGNYIDHLATASDGTVYTSNISNSSLYTIDPSTAVATLIGEIRRDTNNCLVNVHGADIAFDSAGDLFMWSDDQTVDCPNGLYKLTLPVGGFGTVVAEFLGPDESSLFYTGLAFLGNGDLVGSENTDDTVNIINPDGTLNTAFEMFLTGSTRAYSYTFGDMTATRARVEETIYLTDTLSSNDNKSALYTVELQEGTTDKAILTLVTELVGFNHVDLMAASADGDFIYFIDDGATSTKKVAIYDVNANTYTAGNVITGTGPLGSGNTMDQATVSPEGTLYITKNSQGRMYTLNPSNGVATLVGEIRRDTNDTLIRIHGGDLAFTSEGVLYMWNNQGSDDAPIGLYTLELPDGGVGNVIASYQGPASPTPFYTGLALRDNGLGDLIGSESSNDNVNVLNSNGTVSNSFRMYLLGGETPFSHTFGDMTLGPILFNPEL